MGVYLPAIFEVSSIILTSFRQGGGRNSSPPQNEPLKSPPRLGLKGDSTCSTRMDNSLLTY